MTKRLVVAPHVDDDVLGCSSVLDADTMTFFCGVDEHHVVSHEERAQEAAAVYAVTGGGFYWPRLGGLIYHDKQHIYRPRRTVNEYDVPSLIRDLEWAVGEEEPDEVFIPWPSYNQDHRAVYEAALVALRPHDRNHFVPRVLAYEECHVAFWDWAQPGAQFQPTYFVPLNIEHKLHLYALMASQVRGHRAPHHLRALAALRGGAAGIPFAEGFHVLRWVAAE